jgi:hypothetical protein
MRNIVTGKQHSKDRIFVLSLIFIISFTAAFIIAKHIYLPFKNPWNIIGLLPTIKFNPLNNIIRFMLMVGCPSLILFLISISPKADKLFHTDSPQNHNKTLINDADTKTGSTFSYLLFAGSLLICILVALCVPTYTSNGDFDSFHEGEALGPSISLINGKLPYKDFIFVHGIFQDPLRAVTAYKLFGKSIGSVRTLESIMKICTFLLFFVFALKLFKGNYFYAYLLFLLLIILIICKPPFIVLMPRDITTFAFLYFTASLYSELAAGNNTAKLKNAVSFFCFSFLPIASFGYSIDRGFYISATYCILCPIILYGCRHKKLVSYYCIWAASGLLAGMIFLGILLRWQFGAFIDFVFLTFPKYKELMDGMVYPLTVSKPILLLPIIFISLALYWMTCRYIQLLRISDSFFTGSRKYIKTYFMEICLLIMSVFYFRNALGRAEDIHVSYSSAPILILWIYILVRHYEHRLYLIRPNGRKYLTALIVPAVVMIVFYSLFEINHNSLLTENFPLKITDKDFIPKYARTIRFLKDNLNGEENFFTMTSEASWYYFIDKCCPVKFPVVWFAMPAFYQQEVVGGLQKSNVKYILYRNKHWGNIIDGFTSQERLPIVDNYIKANYKYFKTIEDNELWITNKVYISNIQETKL